jgi:hypothetical protein
MILRVQKMRRLLWLPSSLLVLVFASAVLQCQQLVVQTDTARRVLSRADLEALPQVKVMASDHSSARLSYQGVTLKSVLEKAGVTFGESMKGKRLSNCWLVEAADGYRVVIALPELDPAFTDKPIVLALLRDEKPLDEKEGPYRIVIPDEKGWPVGSSSDYSKGRGCAVKKSIFLNHDFGGFDDGGDGIALFQFKFVGAAACDCTLDQIFADANHHMSHHISQLNFFDFSTELIPG